MGDAHELEKVEFEEGEDVTAAIGISAGGDTDEEVEEGLEQVPLLVMSEVDCILLEIILFVDELL